MNKREYCLLVFFLFLFYFKERSKFLLNILNLECVVCLFSVEIIFFLIYK